MAKILINMAVPYANHGPIENRLVNPFYEGFILNLVQMGNSIYTLIGNEITHYPDDLNLRKSLDRETFVEAIRNLDVDLFISFDHSFPAELVSALKCPIVVWFMGPLQAQGDLTLLQANGSRYFTFFRTPELRDYFIDILRLPKDRSFVIPDATDLLADTKPQLRNIVFNGTYSEMPAELRVFSRECLANPQLKPFIQSLWKQFKAQPQQSITEACRSIGFLDFFKANESALQKISEPLRDTIASECRIESLRECVSLGLELYGPPSWLTLLRYSMDLSVCYRPKKMNTAFAVRELYNSAKIGLNINRGWMRGGFSFRARDIMASSAVLLTNENASGDLKRQFGASLKLPTFSSSAEAFEIAQKLLKEPQWRADLVSASQSCIENDHRFFSRIYQMQQHLNMRLIFPNTKGQIEEITTDVNAAA